MRCDKKTLERLSKEQLIYLIEQFRHSEFLIGEICVDESKRHITAEEAVEKISECIFKIPFEFDVADLKTYIDFKLGKISAYEYRKTLGLEE